MKYPYLIRSARPLSARRVELAAGWEIRRRRGLSLSGIPDVVETLPSSDPSATNMATLVPAA
ncbi:MAG: hypothetical protein M3Y39_03315 [Chloroflexota bacterium]|nr:hypothetical protein [Chloroflexota bacterium]